MTDDIEARRAELSRDPTNLDLARALWTTLGSGQHDLRSGVEFVRIVEPCVGQSAAAVFLAQAYRSLADATGDYPKRELLSARLVRFLEETSVLQRSEDLEWLCSFLRGREPRRPAGLRGRGG